MMELDSVRKKTTIVGWLPLIFLPSVSFLIEHNRKFFIFLKVTKFYPYKRHLKRHFCLFFIMASDMKKKQKNTSCECRLRPHMPVFSVSISPETSGELKKKHVLKRAVMIHL